VLEAASVHFKRQCDARNSLEHAFECYYRPFSQLLEIFPRDLRQSWEGLHKRDPSGALLELDRVTDDALQSALDVKSMSRSTAATHLPSSKLELCRAETTPSASQLEAKLQAALVQ
jgi:hypothetical protein